MTSSRPSSHAHKLIAETAKELTHVLYGTVMENNTIFDEWKRQHPGASPKALENAFVAKHWSRAVPSARATLAAMLTGPYDEDMKDKILSALCLDSTLLKGRPGNAGNASASASLPPSMMLN